MYKIFKVNSKDNYKECLFYAADMEQAMKLIWNSSERVSIGNPFIRKWRHPDDRNIMVVDYGSRHYLMCIEPVKGDDC